MPLGVTAQTPPVQGFLEREGIGDLALATCTDPRLRLVASPSFSSILGRFVQEHFGLSVTIVPESQGRTFTTYECRPAWGGTPRDDLSRLGSRAGSRP